MTKLSEIEGIGETWMSKLQDAGVASVEQLLEGYSGKKARLSLAEQTGISEKLVLKWVNKADLCRIKGISRQYADLLENAGVDSVPELAQRRPDSLVGKLIEANESKHLVKKPPSHAQVTDWVTQAKALPKLVTH